MWRFHRGKRHKNLEKWKEKAQKTIRNLELREKSWWFFE
jgi:hypothetical protein